MTKTLKGNNFTRYKSKKQVLHKNQMKKSKGETTSYNKVKRIED